MSEPRLFSARERPDLASAPEATADVWPEYNRHGDVLNRYWGSLDEVFPDFQFVAYDEEADEVLAQGHTIPLAWDGTVEGLPAGIDGLVEEAFAVARDGGRPNTLSAGAVEIPRYPLTPIERYVRWTREDGLPFDPWLRVHRRMGAEVLRPEPESMRITGDVGEWEEWTGMAFPESGAYVFPHGLAPLDVDREADRGIYWEPNVWMRHSVG